jgi:hypothetical protein
MIIVGCDYHPSLRACSKLLLWIQTQASSRSAAYSSSLFTLIVRERAPNAIA